MSCVTSPEEDTTQDSSERPSRSGSRSSTNQPNTNSKRRKNTTSEALQVLNKQSEERSIMLKNLMVQEEDDTEVFMRSMALSIKKLPLHLRTRAKVGILSLVTNLELEAHAPKEPIRPMLSQQQPLEPTQYTVQALSQTSETYTGESCSQNLSSYLTFH